MATVSGSRNNEPSDSPPEYTPFEFPAASGYPLNVPSTTLKDIPSTFQIARTSAESLISASSVVAHLRLLAAFHHLEHSISLTYKIYLSYDPPDPPGAVRWRVFLHQAVWRFELWLKRVVKPRGIWGGALKDEEIPPLDVLLVWHTYLLNPFAYADDTKRIYPELASVGGLPLEKIAAQINPVTLKFEPTTAQAGFWTRVTLAPYEPLSLSPSSHDLLAVECPRCDGPPVHVRWLCEPYLTQNGHAHGTGWCQNQFNAQCENCQFDITRESIAVGCFSADIATAMTQENAVLPGTLFDPRTSTLSESTAGCLTALLLQPFSDLPPDKGAIGEHLGWSFSGIEASVAEMHEALKGFARAMGPRNQQEGPTDAGLPAGNCNAELSTRILKAQESAARAVYHSWVSFGPSIAKMLASYRDNPTPFSMDLVSGIIRQATFTANAFKLGWLDPSNVNLPVARSITRYHNFLHLLSKSRTFLVPTLDIDLGWHTHQLAGYVYMSDTEQHVGRYVDHDDRVEEGVLSNGFDATSHAWHEMFRTPYSSCKASDYAPSHALSLSKVKKLAKRISTHAPRGPDLATYPSEHPATVVVQDITIANQRGRRQDTRAKLQPPDIDAVPFARGVRAPEGYLASPTSGAVMFGEMGRAGWALLGEFDPGVLDAQTVQKGQCAAGYGMPYYGGPLWVGGGGVPSGGCAAGGCVTGAWEPGGGGSVRRSGSVE